MFSCRRVGDYYGGLPFAVPSEVFMNYPVRVVDAEDVEQAIASNLPAFNDIRKTEYLVLRAVRFSHIEAMSMVGLNQSLFSHWLDTDAQFAKWATGDDLHTRAPMRTLQAHVGEDILRAKFMRCVFLQLHVDGELLSKRAFNVDEMSPDERREALEASKRYTAANIQSMMKVLEPDRRGDDENSKGERKITLTVSIDGDLVEDYAHKKAAAKALLSSFTVQDDPLDEGVIDIG